MTPATIGFVIVAVIAFTVTRTLALDEFNADLMAFIQG